jgi:hypothetical protein
MIVDRLVMGPSSETLHKSRRDLHYQRRRDLLR